MEEITTTALTPAALSSMKRSELQKLCKKYGLKANGKNTDLQKKLKQYTLNSKEDNIGMEDIEMMDVDYLGQSQTPSAIPLEQQNKVRSSLVDESPIKSAYQQTTSDEPCLSLILYKESIFSNLAKEREGDVVEPKMEDVNIQKLVTEPDNIDNTPKVSELQIVEPLVSGEKNGLNTIVSQTLNSEQVEINKPQVTNIDTNIFISPLKPFSNLISIEPQTSPSRHIKSVKTERASTSLMARFIAQTNYLPENCPETEAGPALDKNSPFITGETKLNFETTMMQNSIPIQEEKNRAEGMESREDPMDTCDEQSKIKETTNVLLSSSENITAFIYEEMDRRVAQLKALPSPERKKILGVDNETAEIPVATPFKNNASIQQTSSSSVNRFTQVHEKAFSKMPSIATHYTIQKTKTQDEVNRKRKDPDNVQPSFKKQKLAHSTQDSQVTRTAKDIYKKDEKDKVVKPTVKKTYDRNRTMINNRSSMRLNLAKSKNASQAEVQQSTRTSSRFNIQESLKKRLSYVPHKGPVKSIIQNPDDQRKKEREELEKRKQAARNVAQPVLEKMKNQRKVKENIEQIEQKPKVLQNIQNGKIKEKKSKLPSLLPKKVK